MSNHPINLDAIQEGVAAFLATYPDEKALDGRAPTKAPKGAHAVLWIDDFWRGVDMAREALEGHDLQVDGRRGPLIGNVMLRMTACAAALYSLTHEGRQLDYQVALYSLLQDGAVEIDGMDINSDAVDVFVEQIGTLYAAGATDTNGAEVPTGLYLQAGRWQLPPRDPEVLADLCEPG